MNKKEFLAALRKGLSGLSQGEREERLSFYSEMIDDRMEEGLSEEEAVLAVGAVDEITAQFATDIPFAKTANRKIKPKRRLKAWEIILIVVGSPVWLSLLLAVFAVVLSIYLVLWSGILSLWAVFGSFVGCALCGITCGFGIALAGNGLGGIAMIGAGICCAGLAIFLFYGCKAATNGTLMLTKKMAIWIKNCFMKKEEV